MSDSAPPHQPADWRFPRPFGARTLIAAVIALVVLTVTGARVDIDRMVAMTGDAVLHEVGLKPQSQVADGLSAVGRALFPPVIAEATPIDRIPGFEPAKLPPFSHLEVRETVVARMNPATLRTEPTVQRTTYLVEPFGYGLRVLSKLLETLEIGLWGTLLAVGLSAPLALAAASPTTPHPAFRIAARNVASFLRSVPELISALFLVLAYGFGPIAGVLALAFHGAGFLGKFYADDIENADPKPQEALRAIGAGKMKVFQFAILPQVAPQYVAYTLYVLDRNVRMATVIGLVGAGGIGQELKGRYDMYNYGHVATILIAVFVLVMVLDHLSTRLRKALI